MKNVRELFLNKICLAKSRMMIILVLVIVVSQTSLINAGEISISSEVIYSNVWVLGGRYNSHKAACAAISDSNPAILNSRPGSCGAPNAESSCECIYDSVFGTTDIVAPGWAFRDNDCLEGMINSGAGGFPTTCVGSPEKNGSCPADGNPIHILSGNKFQSEQDISHPNGLNVNRYYNSRLSNNLGAGWSFNFVSKRLLVGETDILIIDADGYVDPWSKASGSWVGDPDSKNRVQDTPSFYQIQRANNNVETYDRSGRLMNISGLNGLVLDYVYEPDSGNLESITNQYGQTLQITIDNLGQVTEILSPSGERIKYEYEQSRLVGVIFDDDTPADDNDNPRSNYHYEAAQAKLTGITDEQGNRYSTWEYDAQGRAVSSEHHNSSERTTFNYIIDGNGTRTIVTNPLGKQTTYRYTTLHDVKKVTQVEGHQSANCLAANSNYTYYPSGLLETKTDWQGNTTSYQYNTRNLEISRTEAVGTPQERTITTEWHPTFNLRTKITEPGRETVFDYDAEGRLLSQTSTDLPLN